MDSESFLGDTSLYDPVRSAICDLRLVEYPQNLDIQKPTVFCRRKFNLLGLNTNSRLKVSTQTSKAKERRLGL
jgi:hypothetical protein